MALLLLISGISQAQIVNLSTDDPAQTIYFSTQLRLRGSNAVPWPKVYRSDASGFALISQGQYPSALGTETSGYQQDSVSLSADGGVLAVNSSTPCNFSDICLDYPLQFANIQANGTSTQLPAIAQVSRGGRYVLLARNTGLGPGPNPNPALVPQGGISLLDLQTGSITLLGQYPAQNGKWIASDGTIVAAVATDWVLFSPSGTQTDLGLADAAIFLALAADASFLVYEAGSESGTPALPPLSELRLRRADGSDQLLVSQGTEPTLSAAGRLLLYLGLVNDNLQAFTLDLKSPSNPAQQITSETEGLSEAVLSGDGSTVVATTTLGRLITVHIQSAARTEIIGPTPSVPVPILATQFDTPIEQVALVPGSTFRIEGSNLTDQTVVGSPPLGFEIGGVTVTVAGQPAAVYWAYPSEIAYQVAWETPVDAQSSPPAGYDELVLRSGDPAWEAVIPVAGVTTVYPQYVILGMDGTTELWAIHGDWSGLVSPDDPATPGETVYFYATGLGPLTQPIPTGAAGPVPPLAIPGPVTGPPLNPPLIPTTCRWPGYSGEPLVFPFAGLAPGLVGYYQVAMIVPAPNPSEEGCGFDSFGGGFPVLPPN